MSEIDLLAYAADQRLREENVEAIDVAAIDLAERLIDDQVDVQGRTAGSCSAELSTAARILQKANAPLHRGPTTTDGDRFDADCEVVPCLCILLLPLTGLFL